MPARWSPLRGAAREAAVRSVILYPTNALVEDQIARLRRSLRRIAALGGPHVWFGRYTSACPGGSEMPDGAGRHKRLKGLAGDLRAMVQEFDSLAGLDEVVLSQITDPRRSEMVTRWDMVATPPDILVTNYSMLNVMLMRQFEDPVFAADPGLARARSQPSVHSRRRRASPLPGHAGCGGGAHRAKPA